MPEKFGSYVVLEQLGVGGMATVHVAETRGPDGVRRRVALKRLLEHATHNETLVGLFTDEARLAQYLKHPNITATYDVGQVGETYFIAMELASGPSLAQLLRQVSATIGVIPFPITVNILCQLLDALDYAHNLADNDGNPLGIIHRDVTPGNVVISNRGVVKLIDFGIAKAKGAHQQTQVGTLKGKFSYIAPEYLTGQLDSRCDLWSVGALAHELLTGTMLFDAESDVAVLDRVRHARIDPPSATNPDVPAELDAIVMTALERDPDRRWQAAAAMARALRNAATELQTIVSNEQLLQWVEWAFSQMPPGEDSDLDKLIKVLEVPTRPSARPSEAFDLGTRPKQPTVPVRIKPPPPPLAVPPVRLQPSAPRRRRWPFVFLFVLVLLGGGAYALYYFDMWDELLGLVET